MICHVTISDLFLEFDIIYNHTVPGTVLLCLILVPQKMAAHARLMSSSFAMSDFFCLATDML